MIRMAQWILYCLDRTARSAAWCDLRLENLESWIEARRTRLDIIAVLAD